MIITERPQPRQRATSGIPSAPVLALPGAENLTASASLLSFAALCLTLSPKVTRERPVNWESPSFPEQHSRRPTRPQKLAPGSRESPPSQQLRGLGGTDRTVSES